jgi:hypothetical protein
MINETVIASRQHQTEYHFEAVIDGINPTDTQLRFVVDSGPAKLSFDCESREGNGWRVQFPPFGNDIRGVTSFVIEAIIDGYFVQALTGQIELSDDIKVDIKPRVRDARVQQTLDGLAAKKSAEQTKSSAADRIRARNQSPVSETKAKMPIVQPRKPIPSVPAPVKIANQNKPSLGTIAGINETSALSEAQLLNFIGKLGQKTEGELNDAIAKEIREGRARAEQNPATHSPLPTQAPVEEIIKPVVEVEPIQLEIKEPNGPTPEEKAQALLDFINKLGNS